MIASRSRGCVLRISARTGNTGRQLTGRIHCQLDPQGPTSFTKELLKASFLLDECRSSS